MSEPRIGPPSVNDYRCGHNYKPAECPYVECGYRDTIAALKLYVDWNGAVHVGDCPEDDTCRCPGKPVNDAVNTAIARADRAERGAE